MRKLVYTNPDGTSITFNEGDGYFGITSLTGLGAAELNIQSQKSPYQDGSVAIDRIYSARDITLEGFMITGQNNTLRYTQRRLLVAALNPKLGPGSLVYTNNNGSYYISALPEGPIFANKNANEANQSYQIVFHCEYPFFQDTADTTVTLVSTAAHAKVTITGDYLSSIKAVITGSGSYPKIGEDISGKFIKYNKTMSDTLTITTDYGNKKALITASGITTNAINYITDDSDFSLCLNPGTNYLYVSGIGGTYTAVVTYRQNYAGV